MPKLSKGSRSSPSVKLLASTASRTSQAATSDASWLTASMDHTEGSPERKGKQALSPLPVNVHSRAPSETVPFPSSPPNSPPASTDESFRKLKTSLRSRLDSDSAERERKASAPEGRREGARVLKKPRKEEGTYGRAPSIAPSASSNSLSASGDQTLVDEPASDQPVLPLLETSKAAPPSPPPPPALPTTEDTPPAPLPLRGLPNLRVPVVDWSIKPPGALVSTLRRSGVEGSPSVLDLASRLAWLPLDAVLAVASELPVLGPYSPPPSQPFRIDGKPTSSGLLSTVWTGAESGASLMIAGGWTVAGWFVGEKQEA